MSSVTCLKVVERESHSKTDVRMEKVQCVGHLPCTWPFQIQFLTPHMVPRDTPGVIPGQSLNTAKQMNLAVSIKQWSNLIDGRGHP